MQAGGKQRPVNAGSELLHARIQGIHAGRLRRGLDDAGVRVGFHQTHQPGEAFAAHHAVGVQDHHVAVLTAPTTAEVVDVAALAFDAATATAIEDAAVAVDIAAQLHPRLLLGHADVRIVAVAQDVDIEVFQLTGRCNGLIGRTQAGEHAFDVFVADRHDQRGAVRRIDRLIALDGGRNAVFVLADQQLQEAHQRGPETGRDPAEQYGEQDQNAGLQHIWQQLQHRLHQILIQHGDRIDQRPALIRQDGFHVPGGDAGLHQHQHQQHITAHGADGTPAVLGLGLLFGGVPIVRRTPQKRIPEARHRVGTPCFREHGGSFDRRRRLQNGTPFGVGIEVVIADRIRPGVFDARFDRGQRHVIRRQAIDVGVGGAHLPMERLQCLSVIRRLRVERLRPLGGQRQRRKIILGGLSRLIHWQVADSSRFPTESYRH